MVHVTIFVLRWLFLCRLVDDRAEVQTWPYRRPGYYDHHPQHRPPPAQQQQHVPPAPQHQHDPTLPPPDDVVDMPAYRESCVRALTSWPPGSTERLRCLDELRSSAVRDLSRRLGRADRSAWAAAAAVGAMGLESIGLEGAAVDGSLGSDSGYNDGDRDDHRVEVNFYTDADADNSIESEFHAFVREERQKLSPEGREEMILPSDSDVDDDVDTNANANTDAGIEPPEPGALSGQASSVAAVAARRLLSETSGFLPQLVSTVLHSPPALFPDDGHYGNNGLGSNGGGDPIGDLRSLLVERCRVDPSLGIELCWLLEAEVGRKWKALFEHRQQTGKRLILIVQADIAAAIATIGAEKASAFNLLQDAEQATAFGTERTYEDHTGRSFSSSSMSASSMPSTPRPLRSVSDLRCRHFGDSMHFVDRLTQISLDLRAVPPIHRRSHLRERLEELNRRLRRRMISKGRISIDVETGDDEDVHRGASSSRWSEDRVREDQIKHTIHLPMEPQCVRWPGGGGEKEEDTSGGNPQGGINFGDTSNSGGNTNDFEHPESRNGVVRALRILPEQCRVLASRERCPFMVRMEVAETGLEADDARLYAADAGGAFATVEEALGSLAGGSGGGSGGMGFGGTPRGTGGGFSKCEIPPELMAERQQRQRRPSPLHSEGGMARSHPSRAAAVAMVQPPASVIAAAHRGGYQPGTEHGEGGYYAGDEGGGDGDGFYGAPNAYGDFDTHDMVREQYYEQLHQDLRQKRENQFVREQPPPSERSGTMALAARAPSHTTGSDLLDRVFGPPWNAECEKIRSQSPYRDVEGWKLASFIIKAGEDIRKEALVMQVMSKLWSWFQEEIPEHLRPFLRPYSIMCVGGDAGLVECLPDVKSVDEVKKETDGFTTLLNFFERAFGGSQVPYRPPSKSSGPERDQFGTVSFEKARENFLRSLVGYSVVCYILQIKDRHNANILMDREGHIMHIDFGFVLGETPKMGKVPLFSERAPFKLSAEFWEVIGGWSAFKRFCEMFEAAYAVAAAHSDEICSLVEAAVVNVSRNSDQARAIADAVRGRIRMKSTPKEQKLHIMNIVNDAITSWGTSTYDWLQRSMNGYQ